MMDSVGIDKLEALVQDLRGEECGKATNVKLAVIASTAVMLAWAEGFEAGHRYVIVCTEEERHSVQGRTSDGSIKRGSGKPE
jgi:hypothetical protein